MFKIKPGYDNIAWCYDLLGYLIFGNTLTKAQTEMLRFIPAGCKILIVGGGTGWILEKIAKIHSSGLSITYVDASKEMIKRSKARSAGLNDVKFISQPMEDLNPEPENYDVIITPFFFDNFSPSKCRGIFQQLHINLKKEGLWLFTDFKQSNTGRYWQKYLLKAMYFFFRIVCRLQASRLPDIDHCFLISGYKKITEKMYYSNFVITTVYKKLFI